jgi:hypothetical protein
MTKNDLLKRDKVSPDNILPAAIDYINFQDDMRSNRKLARHNMELCEDFNILVGHLLGEGQKEYQPCSQTSTKVTAGQNTRSWMRLKT